MSSKIAVRPDEGGQMGRSNQVLINVFPIKGIPQGDIFQYDVTIVSETQRPAARKGSPAKNAGKPEFNRALMRSLHERYKAQLRNIEWAYDGRCNVFTARELPFTNETFITECRDVDTGRSETFNVNLKLVSQTSLKNLVEFIRHGVETVAPQEAMAALDIFACCYAVDRNYAKGQNLYSPKTSVYLGDGVEAWGGVYTAIRANKGGLSFNVDFSSGTFLKPCAVIDLACDVWRVSIGDLDRKGADENDARNLERLLKNVTVVTQYQAGSARKFKVGSLTRKGANEMYFEIHGERTSVYDYYRMQHNINLRFPNLPCLVKTGESKSIFPLELCTIAQGQYFNKSLSERQTAGMIKFANQRPQIRAERTVENFRTGGYLDNPFFSNLGLKQDSSMLELTGRILEPPKLAYQTDVITPRDGAWNMRHLAFRKGGVLSNWGVIVLGSERDVQRRDAENFVFNLTRAASKVGINVSETRPPIEYSRANEAEVTRFIQYFDEEYRNRTGEGLKFLLCMLKGNSNDYAMIKRISDVNMGFISQCMLVKHASRIQTQYLSNLLMKINTKLGGGNVHLTEDLPLMTEPVMLIGADVSHPSGGAKNKFAPSVVSLVGSLDRYLTVYTAVCNTQPSKCEDIVCLKEMLRELLYRFKSCTGRFPSRLIFFRDGVSEGQFQTILSREGRAIKSACIEIHQSYAPPVTFLVVQKRHHIRMFPAQDSATDRSGNVLPGTVVDKEIVHPSAFDFYLMSHSGIQGVSRPVRYYILADENGFSSDQLQAFCYKLCYTNSRCTRSTSLPPPVYYAHLVAYRGRILSTIDMWEPGSDTESVRSHGTSKTTASSSVQGSPLLALHDNLAVNRPMFFV